MAFAVAPQAQGATFAGTLYYSTFCDVVGTGSHSGSFSGCPAVQGGKRVHSVNFSYTAPGPIVYSGVANIASLEGADALHFDPNNNNLLVGEQAKNKVAEMTTSGGSLVEVLADGSKQTGQAYGITISPDKSFLLTFPNDMNGDALTVNKVSIPLIAGGNGTACSVTGINPGHQPVGGIYINANTLIIGDAADSMTNGAIYTFNPTTCVATQITTVTDDKDGGANVANALPSHGLEWDGSSLMLTGSNLIWQLKLVSGTWHVVSKIATAGSSVWGPDGSFGGADQSTNDGAGHMFVAFNNGNIVFIDYSAAAGGLIENGIIDEQFLTDFLDDIANGGGVIVPQLTITCPVVTTGVLGQPYSSAFVASGGTAPYHFSLFSGNLPPALQLDPNTGAITGSITATGTYTFVGQVTDSTTPQALTATTGQVACSIAIPQQEQAPGRMTSGGSVFLNPPSAKINNGSKISLDAIRVTHGFELHCDPSQVPNNLEINWPGANNGSNNFHLDTLTSAKCTDDPNVDQRPPAAPFDTLVGAGTGKFNNVAGATIEFTLVDGGEPGTKDQAAYLIKDKNGVTVLSVPLTYLTFGNHQAHKN